MCFLNLGNIDSRGDGAAHAEKGNAIHKKNLKHDNMLYFKIKKYLF
jgi:hypothetical protein